MQQKEWLNAIEAATLLGVNKHTIWRACRRGELVAYKRGNEWQISRAALQRWWGRPLPSTTPPPPPSPDPGNSRPVAATPPPPSMPEGLVAFLARHGITLEELRTWADIPTDAFTALRFARASGTFHECDRPDCRCHRRRHKSP